jgi:cytochrome c peroxidase
LSLTAVWAAEPPSPSLTPNEALGKAIFFDEGLSRHGNQSCAACHDPLVGFTGGIDEINAAGGVYEGSVPGAFGDRKPPSAAYATQSPIFHLDKKGTWTGGNFWDGRATGEVLGNPAADQAQGPFVNPVEQALPDSACVVYHVVNATDYPVSYAEVWGPLAIEWPPDLATDCAAGTPIADFGDRAKSDEAFGQIALSIAAYEGSPEVNAFSSKYDLKGKLTKQERRGRALFQGRANCAACHPSNGQMPLFTDYTFDNLGVPANPENPVYESRPEFIDYGLGGFLKVAGYDEDVYEEELGKHKVPTVRNVAKGDVEEAGVVKAYTHNGYFKTLEGLVHFYNTRDVKDECPVHEDGSGYTADEALAEDCWPAPEVAENVNDAELGDLGLSKADEKAIVAFLRTLSDGWAP